VLKSDVTFPFASPVFFKSRVRPGSNARRAGFGHPSAGARRGRGAAESRRAGLELGAPSWASSGCVSRPQPALRQAWVQTPVYRTPFHLQSTSGQQHPPPELPASPLVWHVGAATPSQNRFWLMISSLLINCGFSWLASLSFLGFFFFSMRANSS